MILAAALSLSLQLVRTSFDLLDGVSVEVVVHNDGKRPVSANFPGPSEYELDLQRSSGTVWTSLVPPPPGAHFPTHARVFMPGPTVLAVYVWNGIASDGTVPAPGTYALRGKLLDTTPSEATAKVRFISPVPVQAIAKLKEGDVVTIAGSLDDTKLHLTDASGTVTLMRPLKTATNGTVVIRGYLTERPDHTHAFFIQRWGMMK